MSEVSWPFREKPETQRGTVTGPNHTAAIGEGRSSLTPQFSSFSFKTGSQNFPIEDWPLFLPADADLTHPDPDLCLLVFTTPSQGTPSLGTPSQGKRPSNLRLALLFAGLSGEGLGGRGGQPHTSPEARTLAGSLRFQELAATVELQGRPQQFAAAAGNCRNAFPRNWAPPEAAAAPAPTPCSPTSTGRAYNQLQQCNPTSKSQLLGMATSRTHIPSIGLIANKFLTPEGRQTCLAGGHGLLSPLQAAPSNTCAITRILLASSQLTAVFE